MERVERQWRQRKRILRADLAGDADPVVDPGTGSAAGCGGSATGAGLATGGTVALGGSVASRGSASSFAFTSFRRLDFGFFDAVSSSIFFLRMAIVSGEKRFRLPAWTSSDAAASGRGAPAPLLQRSQTK